MCKRIAILLLILVFGTTLSSCSPTWMEMYDEYPEAMGKVQIVSEDDEGNTTSNTKDSVTTAMNQG